MIWHASFNLETNLESSQNNLSDCHHCDRNVRNNLLAPTDFNQQGHEGNWKFNDLVITIIDCDIYNDSLQNEWITDILVCVEVTKHFTWNFLAAQHPPSTIIPNWPLLGSVIVEMKDATSAQDVTVKPWPGWWLISAEHPPSAESCILMCQCLDYNKSEQEFDTAQIQTLNLQLMNHNDLKKIPVPIHLQNLISTLHL